MIDLPEGFRYLEKDELVQSGDKWHHNGTYLVQWIQCKKFGEQLPYNTYCRKL